MKRNQIAAVILLLCLLTLAMGLTLEVKAPKMSSSSKPVFGVDWKSLPAKTPELSPENARVRDAGGKVLVSQTVDNDGDGKIDELLFLDPAPGDKPESYEILADASLPMPELAERAFARYVPERMDDFAWENDLVAFRAYGQGLKSETDSCGVDCFMKRVKYPVVDRWYAKEDYHTDYGEGYDGYKVGTSLGCGGAAVWKDGKLWQPGVYASQRQFANGPLRAVFELSYGPWEVDGQKITEKKVISLEVGQRLFKVEDHFLVDGKPTQLEIAIGLTTHEGKAAAFGNRDKGYLYTWEKIDGSFLGTAVVTSPRNIKEYKLIKSEELYQGHALFIVSTGDQGEITYYAGYGWDRAKEIVTREQWEDYLKQFIADLAHPPGEK